MYTIQKSTNYDTYLNDDPRLRTLVLCRGKRFTVKHLKNP